MCHRASSRTGPGEPPLALERGSRWWTRAELCWPIRNTTPKPWRTMLGALARSLNQMAAETQGLVERLKLESARREAILSSMVEGVLAVDHNARITFCNESFTRILGLPAGNLEHRPLVELVRDPELLE